MFKIRPPNRYGRWLWGYVLRFQGPSELFPGIAFQAKQPGLSIRRIALVPTTPRAFPPSPSAAVAAYQDVDPGAPPPGVMRGPEFHHLIPPVRSVYSFSAFLLLSFSEIYSQYRSPPAGGMLESNRVFHRDILSLFFFYFRRPPSPRAFRSCRFVVVL